MGVGRRDGESYRAMSMVVLFPVPPCWLCFVVALKVILVLILTGD